MARPSLLLLAMLVPLAGAGCFPNPNYQNLPDSSVIGRQNEILGSLSIADLKAPTDKERTDIASSLAAIGDQGLRIRVLLAAPDAAMQELEVRRRLSDLGVPPGIALLDRAAGVPATQLVFVRTRLTPPDCAQLVTPNEAFDFGHFTYSSPRPTMAFGCATYTNLSRQIADPADLAAPRPLDVPDATTSAAAIQRYHDNTVTPLRKTTTVKGGSGGGQ